MVTSKVKVGALKEGGLTEEAVIVIFEDTFKRIKKASNKKDWREVYEGVRYLLGVAEILEKGK